MAGVDQPPHHVDVLAGAQRFVEPTDRPQCVDPHHQRRGGDVADASAGSDASLLGPEVERRSRRLVERQRGRTFR